MKTKRSKKLNLKDRLSRLTYVATCQLLGENGKQLIREGGTYDNIDIDRDVHLGNDLFRLNLVDLPSGRDAIVTITLMASQKNRLRAPRAKLPRCRRSRTENCFRNDCRKPAEEHVVRGRSRFRLQILELRDRWPMTKYLVLQ